MSYLFLISGLIGFCLFSVTEKDRKDILARGKKVNGLVVRRYWKGVEYIRNHWDYRLTALVEFENEKGEVVERDLKIDRKLYIPPSSGKLIRLILYAGEVYDEKALNRRIEKYLSLVIAIVGLLWVLKEQLLSVT